MKTPSRRNRCIVAGSTLVFLALLLAGCSERLTMLPVEGQVLVDGKPLSKGEVVLWPEVATGEGSKVRPGGKIENGKFQVRTLGKPGAPAGRYKVTIITGDRPDSSRPFAVRGQVAARFRDPGQTPLFVEVAVSPRNGAYDLKTSSR